VRDRRAQFINMGFFGPSVDAIHALITEMSRGGVVFMLEGRRVLADLEAMDTAERRAAGCPSAGLSGRRIL
jgi:hypothetical protein